VDGDPVVPAALGVNDKGVPGSNCVAHYNDWDTWPQ